MRKMTEIETPQTLIIQNGNEELNDEFHEQELPTYVSEVKRRLEKECVTIPGHCKKFIERCLRVKNYDVEKAAQLVRNFGIMMSMPEMHDLYAKFEPSKLQELYFRGAITPSQFRDSLGRLVIVGRAASWNPDEFDFDQSLAALIVLMNYAAAQSPQCQRVGMVFLLDFGGWTLHHIRSVKFGRLKLVAKLMQNSCPGKIKGIHIIRYPKFIFLLFSLIKPFLKAKLRTRIHFHGEIESLINADPKLFSTISDKDAAGSCSSRMDEQLVSRVIKSDKYCQEMVKCGYPAY